MQEPANELPRIPLPRTSLNRPWALLRAAPLHAVHHLLGLGRELIERVGRSGKPNHHRVAFHVLKDEDPTLSIKCLEVSDSFATALIKDVQAVRTTITVVVLGQVIDEHLELLALESSYGDRLWFGGFKVRVMLQPPDEVFGSLHHVRRAGLEDFLDVGEAYIPCISLIPQCDPVGQLLFGD